MARTCIMFAVSKVMFLGVLAQHAPSCRVISCWISCLPFTSAPDTQHEIPLRPALFLYVANNSSLLPCHSPPAQTNLTSTGCDVMTTSIVAPTQHVAHAQRGVCTLHLRVCARMNLEKRPNCEHYTLDAATSCADGLTSKRHTSCVASRIVRLLATWMASGQETARFE